MFKAIAVFGMWLAISSFALAGDVRERAAFASKLDRLVAAYPAFLQGHDGRDLIWKDGARMRFDDGQGKKSFNQMLKTPDLEDQFFAPYVFGKLAVVPGRNEDPGRVRYQPFFVKMYGDCRKKEVARQLVKITWLPKHDGRTIRVTRVNGIDRKLQQISHELDSLIDSDPAMKQFLSPPAGTYNCRTIAGTKRYSVHAYGAAIDLNVKQAHYWRWTRPTKSGLYPWRNKIPHEIVEIFERHGFIWGGKWYHYDTMHFEYRPELLPHPK